MNSILEKKISVFESTQTADVYDQIEIQEVFSMIQDGSYMMEVEELRGGDEDQKLNLPTFALQGIFDRRRKKSDFIEATGIVILDIDNIDNDEIEDTKLELMSNKHMLAAMISPSGNGVKALYMVQEDCVTADTYKAVGKIIADQLCLAEYGDVDVLSLTDTLIMTYDPGILINELAIPNIIEVKEAEKTEAELPEIDPSRDLYDDAEEFFDTVLFNSIAERSNNNFEFIQWSVFDLVRYGFRDEDLSFIIAYSEDTHKKSKENEKRLKEAIEVSKDYPQTSHPYRMSRNKNTNESSSIKSKESMGSDVDTKLSDLRAENKETIFEEVVEVIKEGNRVGKEISLSNFADVFRFKGSGVLTVTGIPGHGKTEFVDQMLLDLARLYGDRSIIAGFEQSHQEHLIKLSRKLLGTDITCPSYWASEDNLKDVKLSVNYLYEMFNFLDINKVGSNVSEIIKAAESLIKDAKENNRSFQYLLIDPYNMLSISGRKSSSEKAEDILRELTRFSHLHGIMVILVAHPFKMKKDEKTGYYEIPDFYSVKGSSAFFEMSYHGISVYRKDPTSKEVMVRILKVKQNNLGQAGADVYFSYHVQSGRYIPLDDEKNELPGSHDHKDWLDKVIIK